MFYSCSNITELNLRCFNTINLTNMTDMFSNCSKLKSIYVSNDFTTINLNNITNPVFSNCAMLKGGNDTSYSNI